MRDTHPVGGHPTPSDAVIEVGPARRGRSSRIRGDHPPGSVARPAGPPLPLDGLGLSERRPQPATALVLDDFPEADVRARLRGSGTYVPTRLDNCFAVGEGCPQTYKGSGYAAIIPSGSGVSPACDGCFLAVEQRRMR